MSSKGVACPSPAAALLRNSALLSAGSAHPPPPVQLFDVWLEPEVTVHVRQQEGPFGLVFEAQECRWVACWAPTPQQHRAQGVESGAFHADAHALLAAAALQVLRLLPHHISHAWIRLTLAQLRHDIDWPVQAQRQRAASAPWAGQAVRAALPHRCFVAAPAQRREQRPLRRRQSSSRCRGSGASGADPSEQWWKRPAGADQR